MVINLPDGAKPISIKDGSVIRDGFIMPDGSAYMIDDNGKTSKVNIDKIDKEKSNDTITHQNEGTFNDKYNIPTNASVNRKSKLRLYFTFAVIGILCVIIILCLAVVIGSIMSSGDTNRNNELSPPPTSTPKPTPTPTPKPTPIPNPIVGNWQLHMKSMWSSPTPTDTYETFTADGSINPSAYETWPDGTQHRTDPSSYVLDGTWKPDPNTPNGYFFTVIEPSSWTHYTYYSFGFDVNINEGKQAQYRATLKDQNTIEIDMEYQDLVLKRIG